MGDFQGRRACIKLTRNIELLSVGYPPPPNYLVYKVNETLNLSSICKSCEDTTLQHTALMSAEKLQAEEYFLTTAGWKKSCGQSFLNNCNRNCIIWLRNRLGFFGGGGSLIFLSREGKRERSETLKLCVYLNIILLGVLQTLLVFPRQCGYSIIHLCHERKYYFLQCSRRHPLQSSSLSVIWSSDY